MKRFARILLIVLIVAALGGAGYWYFFMRPSAAQTASTGSFTETVAAQKGDLNATISIVGELASAQSASLAFDHLSGRTQVTSLPIQAGTVVTAGQILATIDPTPYQQALDQANSALEDAQTTLTDLQTPPTALEIAQADLTVATAEYNLAQAQDGLDQLVHPDITALQSSVHEAESTLAQAESDLAELQNDTTTADKISTLQETSDTVAATYNRLATESYSDTYYQDRLEVAYNKAMDAQDALVTAQKQQQLNIVKAQLKVRQSATKLADAQDALAKAQAGGDPLALAEAQLAVRNAQVSLDKANQDRADLDAGPDAVELASDRATVEKNRLAVADAQVALDAATIVAPFAGTVLNTYANAGDFISSGTAILDLADMKQLEVLAAVDEITIRQVSVGQKATISFDAYPGQTFNGVVLSVPMQGTLQGNVMVYEVTLSLEGAELLPLLVGMTANVSLNVGSVQDALLIPTMAIQSSNGAYQVLIPGATPEDQPQAVPVEIGLSNGTYTQIVRGLNVGDKVLVTMNSSSSQDFRMGGGGGGILGGAGRVIVR